MTTDTLKIRELLKVTPVGNTGSIPVQYLLTDSRSLSVAQTTLFFAISSSRREGFRFMRSLYERGVRAFVTDNIPEDMKGVNDAAIFLVPDPVRALQQVAAYHPDFHGEMVAITGSRGKTTLKEWLFQLMEPYYNIIRSPRSYNSQIGVPLSLWEILPDTQIALIEAGVSKTNEMSRLAECINPDTVIITNIGDAHAEGFASKREKSREKLMLARGKEVKKLIYPIDDKFIREEVEILKRERPEMAYIGWSVKDKDAALFITPVDEEGVDFFRIKYSFHLGNVNVESEISLKFTDDNNLSNAAGALAFMLSEGLDAEKIGERFASLHPIKTRLNVLEGINGCSLVIDSYTSDFSSLRPALDFVGRRTMPGMKRILVMSDLRHEASSEIYPKVAQLVELHEISEFIGIGEGLKKASESFPEGSKFFSSVDEMLENMTPSDFTDSIILLKGAPEYGFDRIQEMLEARTHETVLEVNLDAVIRNYNYFRSHVPSGTGMIAMVKASGYGAGSYEIAKTLQDCGAAYLAVAVLDEGIELRERGITMPIMVMNPKVVNYGAMFENSLEPEIYSLAMLRDVVREAEKYGRKDYPVHIKLDTGMHRMGFVKEELPLVMDIIDSQRGVRIKSVFSHLATADCPDMDDYTMLQLNLFKEYSDYIISRSRTPVLRHILNSAGILRFPKYHYDMVRLGIGLYGANTLPPEIERPLSVVSSLRTVIIAIREWKKGESIGYARKGMLKRDSRIATIPIGYADGMNRHFGCGAISVKVNGKDAPTVGNICMDACMIDVTEIDCKEGDAVEIFGSNADVQRLADVLGTIPYEVLTSVSPRVKRVYFRE